MKKFLYWGVVPLLSLAIIGLLYIHIKHPYNIWVTEYFPNLITTFVGIIITVTVVDKILEKDKKIRNNKYAETALKKIGEPFYEITNMFFKMIKASTDPETLRKYKNLPSTYEELFKSELINELPFLYFKAKAPSMHGMLWYEYAAETVTDNFKKINELVDAYAIFLEPDFVAKLHELETHSVICILKYAKIILANTQPDFMSGDMMKEFFDKMIFIIKNLENHFPPLKSIRPSSFENGVATKVEDSRIAD